MSKRPLPRIVPLPVTVIGYPPSNEVMSPVYTNSTYDTYSNTYNTTGKRGRDDVSANLVRNPNKRQRNIQEDGPIYWDDGYKLAVKATNAEGMRNFEDYVRLLDILLPCDVCKGHFQDFKRTTRLSSYKHVKDDSGNYIGYFVWWFILQNNVRERQGKPLWQFNDTYFMYYEEESKPCKNCSIGRN